MNKSPAAFKSGILRNLVLPAVICILGLVAYLNSLLNLFVWDDIVLIVNNLHIRNLAYIPRLFLENIYYQDMVGHFYRPLLITTFAFDYHFWGLEPLGYHLTNILFHLASGVLVYYFIRLVADCPKTAFLTSLFFVLHPVQTEAVTYISGRADPLAAFFCLASLIFFAKHLDYEGNLRKFFYAASILFFIFGLLSKEASAILPLIFILYEACFNKRGWKPANLSKYLPIIGVLLIYFFVRNAVLIDVKSSILVSNYAPLYRRLLTIPLVIATYFKLLVFPAGLHMERLDYVFDLPASLFEPRVMISSTVILLAGLSIWLNRRRARAVFFGFLWFIVTLFPVLNIIPINAFVAEHWLYFPSIGFFMLASIAFVKLLDIKYIKLYVTVILIDIFLFLGALTVRQNYVWRNPVIFYKYIMKYSPQSARLHTNIGVIYLDLKLYKEAEREYLEALKIDSHSKQAVYHYLNLGTLYLVTGKDDEAMKMYEEAIKLEPGNPVPYNFIGKAYNKTAKYKDAIRFYKKAAELSPSNSSFWNDLGWAYLNAGLLTEAADSYEKGISIYPYDATTRGILGDIYDRAGNPKRALEEYKVAMELTPDDPSIYFAIGNVCAKVGAYEQARYFWQKTLEIDPEYADAKRNLGKLQEQTPEKNRPHK